MRFFKKSFVGCVALAISNDKLPAQLTPPDNNVNTITTAVPFLLITPDSRAGAMGDAGAASSPDANTIHWNASKLAFANNKFGLSVSYTPWLRSLVPEINMAYVSGYYKINNNEAISGSLRYFSLGEITFTNSIGVVTGQFTPYEFALDGAYSRKLNKQWAAGMALRYIYSDLTGGAFVNGIATKHAEAVAADFSACYNNDDIKITNKKSTVSWGVNISNIGSKMYYSSSSKRDFIPINIKTGAAVKINMNEFNSIAFVGDINKLLVPTPPIYGTENGQQIILSGQDPDRGVVEGMIGSFYDAPGQPVLSNNGGYIYNSDSTSIEIENGSVFKEEINEINCSIGMEYWYDNQLAIRAGYFYEDETKGNRKYFTLGAGLKYNVFALDFAYLIPIEQRNPLANTLRFSLHFDFDSFSTKKNQTELQNQQIM